MAAEKRRRGGPRYECHECKNESDCRHNHMYGKTPRDLERQYFESRDSVTLIPLRTPLYVDIREFIRRSSDLGYSSVEDFISQAARELIRREKMVRAPSPYIPLEKIQSTCQMEFDSLKSVLEEIIIEQRKLMEEKRKNFDD